MKIAICDDEKRIRDVIAEQVRLVSEKVTIECFSDADGILTDAFDADILFLDIQMPGLSGMEAAKKLREQGKKTVLIFVTAIEEEVFSAFDVGAFQYIVKPVTGERIREVTRKALLQAAEQKRVEKLLREQTQGEHAIRTLLVKSGGVNTRVVLTDIVYAEVFDRRIVLHTKDGESIEYYGRISDLAHMAGTDFFRVHRAYLINLSYVKSYDAKNVNVMGEEIPVARGKYQELVKACLTHHTRRERL